MQTDFTPELTQLMKFTGETATAIRLYSAYSGGSPSAYLDRPADPKRDAVDLMFLADALHHFLTLGLVLERGNPKEIVDACDRLLLSYSDYDTERPEFGPRQAKPTFETWRDTVRLLDARAALSSIRQKAATFLLNKLEEH